MNYQQIQPPDYLKRYVRYFWALNQPSATDSPKTFRPISDGCPGLFFQQPDTSAFYDQTDKQLPSLYVYGQTIRHRELHTSGPVRAVGICFHPYALNALFGFDADELTDDCVDFNALVAPPDTLSAIFDTSTTDRQIELLSACLLAQIQKNRIRQDYLADYALSQLIQSQGQLSLPEIRANVNLSERSFERRFKQRVGISPKLFSRICRFQASLHQLRTNSYARLSDIAFDNGYADQSHFIRVFKEFTGFSPYQYHSQSNEVVRNLAEWMR